MVSPIQLKKRTPKASPVIEAVGQHTEAVVKCPICHERHFVSVELASDRGPDVPWEGLSARPVSHTLRVMCPNEQKPFDVTLRVYAGRRTSAISGVHVEVA
ncbi:MAG: hypothetical protein GYB68_00425 [Chloroflexi bacterium]|nr:hypothetical protein [Chloroflexota bacterium]